METNQVIIPTKPIRHFLPQELSIDSWDRIKLFFQDLKERKISSAKELEKWMLDRSELEAALSEDMAWRYIKMTCDTANKKLLDSYNFFVTEIEPHVAPFNNELNKKLVASIYLKELDQNKYHIYLRGVKKALELYRDENIPLLTKIQTESQKYGAIAAAMTIEWKGEEITLQKAASFLKDTDRSVREEIYFKIQQRRNKDKEKLNDLFSELLQLRHQVALNAGFSNYRDYKFEELGRFDYTVKDCTDFHESIAKEVLPLAETADLERKKALKLESLKPWDTDVDLEGRPALKPFSSGAELLDKSIECFYKVRHSYGEYLEIMKTMGHLDLESRIGKAPGGYNYPLYEIGVPFIFMNSVGTQRDLVTMVHEGGHAIHSFVTRDLELVDFKSTPSEVAELASMSMELISMEHWDVFFKNADDLKRAKKEQLEKSLNTLLWIAAVDKFQHWIYENPKHTVEERMKNWENVINQFQSKVIDWKGFEEAKSRSWQNQLHIFEVPFYYIEYGMAQLGAIAVWRNYKRDPEQGLNNYEAALRLGYTKSIPEIYKAAGIEFNFSQAYVKELADFVKNELEKI
ncbi:MAG: oligoendopeptidase F [Bacteroidetes bacterium RIFCSPLOWO2_12_FULL_35_15]|nr:MAG: oligoendopeptidase F [Bacteroidetes bacterium RIFCSPLOWO2_12_FULL_35_15]